MIKVGAIRQGIHRSWNYELKMRYSLEECKQTYLEKENNRKQSENAVGGVPQEKQGSQWRWKEGYRLHTEEWDGLHELNENKIMCMLYQS